MRVRFNIGSYHFFISVYRTGKVTGVNSKLPSGRHFLMWDFDDTPMNVVKQSLSYVQKKWRLAPIYIVNTGLHDYYHAYCFSAKDWGTTLHILADTPELDQMFFRIGVIRGYFTLRFTPKHNRDFKPALILGSKVREDINPYEICSFITYDTKRR